MRWLHKFNVNKYVINGSPENFKEIAKKIYGELKSYYCFKNFDLSRLLSVKSVTEFDDVWCDLYDYCDENRIWLGFS